MSAPQVFRKRLASGRLSGTYYFRWVGPAGRRRTISCRTSDKRAAERVRDDYIVREEAIARGDISPDEERLCEEARKPIREHVAEYIEYCRSAGQDPKGIEMKKRHLDWLLAVAESFNPPWRLDGIRADAIEVRLAGFAADGAGASTVNGRLRTIRAFVAWCVQRGRLERDPLRVLRARNEIIDRRRIRRALTQRETDALLAVARDAEARGYPRRWLFYGLALHAGLRRGDLSRLTWGAIDIDTRTLTIRGGKARHRVDRIPLAPVLVDELRRVRPSHVLPSARVWPQVVSNSTRIRDFDKAGIVYETEQGIADLHSLRVTFGTRLALEPGITPAVHQRLMRHASIEMTMRYYVNLGIDPLRAGVEALDARYRTNATP